VWSASVGLAGGVHMHIEQGGVERLALGEARR